MVAPNLRTLALVSILVAPLLAGCIEPMSTEPDAPAPTVSPTARPVADPTDPTYPSHDCAERPTPDVLQGPPEKIGVVNASNLLGVRLLRALDACENVIISPFSVMVLLGMAYAGADGETAEAIGQGLGISRDDLETFRTLLPQLRGSTNVTLDIANSLWLQPGFNVRDDYRDLVVSLFNGSVETADLTAESGADAIDAWANESTHGLIESIASDLGLPHPQALLALLNAVYFKGDWTHPFDPEETEDAAFKRPDGTEVQVPLMRQRASFPYVEMDNVSVLRLPYGDEERFVFDVFLPAPESDLDSLIGRFDTEYWRQAQGEMENTSVRVYLPRFEASYGSSLDDALRSLGLGALYPPADFDGMSSGAIGFSTIAHKTFIRVDEVGTEAAAVTGGVVWLSQPPTFRVDRPFLFVLADRETETMLFLGAVRDPTAAPA